MILYPIVVIAKAERASAKEQVIVFDVPIPEPEPEPLTPEDLITLYAEEYGVDPELGYDIAFCESFDTEMDRLDPNAKNPNSTASGIFQFLRGSWEYYGVRLWGSIAEKDVFNAEHNIELAMYVLSSKRGTLDWSESEHCWGA